MTEQLLLIMVSVATILLLVYTIIVMVLLTKILKRIKKIAERTGRRSRQLLILSAMLKSIILILLRWQVLSVNIFRVAGVVGGND